MELEPWATWWHIPSLPGMWSFLAAGVYVLGVINAAHAIMRVRLSQSAIAWSVFLLSMPWLGIPLYWVFGRRKFEGYTTHMRLTKSRYDRDLRHLTGHIFAHFSAQEEPLHTLNAAAVRLGAFPFTKGNDVALLIDGAETYRAMLADIRAAKEYILFQTYILSDDGTGRQFLEALAAAVSRGVKVFLLYDEIGSTALTRRYLRLAAQRGIITSGFKTTQKGNRFQLNFRNHRKITVIDGSCGFLGGLNIGDEHLGQDPELGGWRDTHTRIQGPAVAALQYSFLSDWYWAMNFVPPVRWGSNERHASSGSAHVLILATGPADRTEACSLFVGSLIDLAKQRIWIATPYFVPDEPTLSALKIAALRGVDVRIIVPRRTDHRVMRLCTLSYYEELRHIGIKVYEYLPCFMHQKVFLIDDFMAGVGTVNLDNRSFHLNFEAMAYVASPDFVRAVSSMLQKDLDNCAVADLNIYDKLPLPTRIAIKVTRLFSAVL